MITTEAGKAMHGLGAHGEEPCHLTNTIVRIETEAKQQAFDELEAVKINWWICVWCDTKFPYEDGPGTLKAHSATCEKHPAVIRLHEVIPRLEATIYARDETIAKLSG